MSAQPQKIKPQPTPTNASKSLAIASALPTETDPLFELARLAPKLAIDAAMALLGSDDPKTRKSAVRLGAKVASSQGSNPSRSDSLTSFMAHRALG